MADTGGARDRAVAVSGSSSGHANGAPCASTAAIAIPVARFISSTDGPAPAARPRKAACSAVTSSLSVILWPGWLAPAAPICSPVAALVPLKAEVGRSISLCSHAGRRPCFAAASAAIAAARPAAPPSPLSIAATAAAAAASASAAAARSHLVLSVTHERELDLGAERSGPRVRRVGRALLRHRTDGRHATPRRGGVRVDDAGGSGRRPGLARRRDGGDAVGPYRAVAQQSHRLHLPKLVLAVHPLLCQSEFRPEGVEQRLRLSGGGGARARDDKLLMQRIELSSRVPRAAAADQRAHLLRFALEVEQ